MNINIRKEIEERIKISLPYHNQQDLEDALNRMIEIFMDDHKYPQTK